MVSHVHVHVHVHFNRTCTRKVTLELTNALTITIITLLSKLKSRVTPPLPSGLKIHKESKMPTILFSTPKVNEIDPGRIVENCAKTMKNNMSEKPKYKFVTVTTKSETIRY